MATLPNVYLFTCFSWCIVCGQNISAPTVADRQNETIPAEVPANSSDTAQTVLERSNVCNSTVCKEAAENVFGAINSSADPCGNFFQYACGSWIVAQPGRYSASFFQIINNKAVRTAAELLDQKKGAMFEAEVKAKSFFAQCKNEGEQQQLGPKPLLDLLDDLIGGWPILNPNWNASNFDLLAVLVKTKEHGDEPFFAITVDQDRTSPPDNVIIISEPKMEYTKDVLLSEAGPEYTENFLKFTFAQTLQLMSATGDKRNESDVAGDLTDLFEIGRFITLNSQTAVEKRDLNYLKNKTSLGANQQATFTRSELFQNMTALLRTMFSTVGMADKITSDTPVILQFPSYFDRIDQKLLELEKLGAEGKRRLANYIGWRLISKNLRYINYPSRTSNTTKPKPQGTPMACVTGVKESFPLVLGAVLVRDRLPADLKAKASIMVANIKLGFRDLLNDASWMDNVTVTEANRKLDNMLTLVAYSDLLVNNISLIDAKYQNITIGPTYFATIQALAREKTYRNLRALTEKNQRDDSIGHPIDITKANAENTIEKNLVTVTAAILQRPFFQADNPQYLNYGGMGFSFGHEVTHSFDDQGAMYDADGTMRNWWSNSTRDAYNVRKQTFVDQYNAFSLPSGHVNGLLTLSENIADNGGLRAAYRAYFNHYQKQIATPEPLLPGQLNATTEQLFFLAAAQVWCSRMTPYNQRLQLLQDEHSPSEFRVIGPMSNMPEFAKAFNCPVGSPMNPLVKHAVW